MGSAADDGQSVRMAIIETGTLLLKEDVTVMKTPHISPV